MGSAADTAGMRSEKQRKTRPGVGERDGRGGKKEIERNRSDGEEKLWTRRQKERE